MNPTLVSGHLSQWRIIEVNLHDGLGVVFLHFHLESRPLQIFLLAYAMVNQHYLCAMEKHTVPSYCLIHVGECVNGTSSDFSLHCNVNFKQLRSGTVLISS